MFAETVKLLLKTNGRTQTELAEFVDVKPNTVSDWLNQGNSPKLRHIYRIADYFNVSVGELFGDKKSALSEIENDILALYKSANEQAQRSALFVLECGQIEKLSSKRMDNVIYVHFEDDLPADRKDMAVFYQPASAGTGAFLDSDDYEMVEVPINPVTIRASFGIRVSGNSMEPDFEHEDIVFVNHQPTLNDGEIGVFTLNGDAYLKRLSKSTESIRLVSLNPEYNPILVKKTDDFRVVGKVIGKFDE